MHNGQKTRLDSRPFTASIHAGAPLSDVRIDQARDYSASKQHMLDPHVLNRTTEMHKKLILCFFLFYHPILSWLLDNSIHIWLDLFATPCDTLN